MTEKEFSKEHSVRKPSLPNICPDCLKDEKIKCPRNTDAKCLECGVELCGYHIGKHLYGKHLISLEWRGIGAEPE